MDLRLKTLLLIGGLIFTKNVWGFESLYVPAYCNPTQHNLQVENKTKYLQRLWTQVRVNEKFLEQSFDIPASGQLQISATDFLNENLGFSIRIGQENSLRIASDCNGKTQTLLTRLTSPAATHLVSAQTKKVHLHILNLFFGANFVHLKAMNTIGITLAQQQIQIRKYYDTSFIDWDLPEGTTRIEVNGQQRLHSFMFFDSGREWQSSPAVVLQPVRIVPDQNKIYFLAAARNSNTESFVVGIDDIEMIATAREQIRNPNLEKIIVAGAQTGNGGYNRSFSSIDKSPYSWSIFRVDAFADFAPISCDGSPDFFEERLEQKLNEGGRICFWRFRIVRELSVSEVQTGKLLP